METAGLDFARIADITRWVSTGQLVLLAVRLWNRGLPGRLAGALCATLVCYLAAPEIMTRFNILLLRVLILSGAFAVAYSLWLFSRAAFDDHFRLSYWHGLGLAGLEGLSFFFYLAADTAAIPAGVPARLFPQVVNLGFILMTLFESHRGLAADLIETRRKFRRVLIQSAAVYIVLVLSVEMAFKGAIVPAYLDQMNVLAVSVLVFFFSFRLLEARSHFFPESPAPTPGDTELAARIHACMIERRPYLQENLSAKTLAGLVAEQEYKVRRAINGAMGYRNFYDFLNHYRVEEICKRLTNPEDISIPIVRLALESGFGSLAPFNRAFKALKGMSPREFRRLHTAGTGGKT